jgi:multiple sugar transport system substrate-binding protein
MFWGDKGEKAEQDADVQLAEKACPGLHVTEIWDQGNYDNDLATKIGSGNAPDVFQIDAVKYLKQYVAQGALVNMDSYIQRDNLNLSTIYWPACLPEASYQGHVWGLERDCGNQGVLFYNKDMFDAKKVAYPTDTWTYDDLAKAAAALSGNYALPTDSTSRLRFGYALNEDDYRINQYMWDWGGDWLSEDLKTCTMTSKPSQAAFTWFINLAYQQHGAPTATQAASAGDYVGGFRDQHYAMTFAGPWALDYMVKPSSYTGVSAPTFHWGAVLTPKGPGGSQALVDSSLEVISAKSSNKDAAWWLSRFLTEGPGGALEGEYGIGIPAAMAVANSPSVKNEYGPLSDLFTQALKNGRVMRTVPQYTKFWDTVNTDLTPMWKNQESVAAATAKACQDVAPLLPK